VEKCNKVKEIFSNIDWPCEVKTLYREKNMGCHEAIPNSISWFFSQVDAGIILEDDCLPDESFFPYCAELLEKYKSDERIMMISGDNFLPDHNFSDNSYFYSKYAFIWGWATWKRAWDKFDNDMKTYPAFRTSKEMRSSYPNFLERFFWRNGFDKKYNGYEGWDLKWGYTLISNRGFNIIPTKNLVKNIGFGPEATATKRTVKSMIIPTESICFPLVHPKIIDENKYYDRSAFRAFFLPSINPKTVISTLILRIKGKLKS
jgi:hypothetical protein